jgi:hypothetical protein
MVACDFLTVDTVLFIRWYVLVFIEPATRRHHVAGITAHPTGPWVPQRASQLSERLSGHRFLIRDRDTKFADRFDAVFAANSAEVIKGHRRRPGQHYL